MAQSLFTSSAVLSISAADWRTFPPRPPLVLSAKSPHKCQRCSYCFKFETKKNFSRYGAVRDNFAPYDSSTLKVSLKDAVQAAQDDCQFHQWILHLILRNIHDPNPKFPSHAEVEITLNLQKIYKTEFIPHDFIQQDGRRLKWDPSKRLKETLTEPFIQYRYQAASSPYCVDVRASIKRVNGIVASGCDSFSFCRTGGYSADLKDDIPCITRTPMIEWDKRSERSLGFVRTCLSTCRELHLDCKPLNRSKREPRVPTRLLHIQSASSTGYVRLIDFARLASAPGAFKGYLMLDYAILSYCWEAHNS